MKNVFFPPEVVKNIHGIFDKMDERAKQQEYDRHHTADGVELKIGLVVYHVDDPNYTAIVKKLPVKYPSVEIECREEKDRRKKYIIGVPSTKLFFEQCMAFNAKLIKDKEAIIQINKEIESLEQKKKDRLEILFQTEDEFAMMINKNNRSLGRICFNVEMKSRKYRDKRKKK